MSAELIASLTIFALAVFLGFELIGRVPTLLHTPLMSGHERDPRDHRRRRDARRRLGRLRPEKALAFVAIVFGTINVVGGFLVTDRMLDMFRRRRERATSEGE